MQSLVLARSSTVPGADSFSETSSHDLHHKWNLFLAQQKQTKFVLLLFVCDYSDRAKLSIAHRGNSSAAVSWADDDPPSYIHMHACNQGHFLLKKASDRNLSHSIIVAVWPQPWKLAYNQRLHAVWPSIRLGTKQYYFSMKHWVVYFSQRVHLVKSLCWIDLVSKRIHFFFAVHMDRWSHMNRQPKYLW